MWAQLYACSQLEQAWICVALTGTIIVRLLMVDTAEVIEAGGTIVVLAGATARKGALDAVANSLRKRGVEVRIASGIERSMVGLLQVSFRYRDGAVYLLCGGAQLPKPELDRLVAAIGANGAPTDRVWAGELDWTRPDSLVRDAEHRLAALGVDLGPEPTPPKAPPPPRTTSPKGPVSRTIVAMGGPSTPIPGSKLPDPMVPPVGKVAASKPPAAAGNLASNVARKSRTPSVNVPIVSSSNAGLEQDDDLDPRGPMMRFLSSSVGKGIAAGAVLMLVGVVAWRVSASDDASDPDETSEVATAAVMEASVAAQPDTPRGEREDVDAAKLVAEPAAAAVEPETAVAPVPADAETAELVRIAADKEVEVEVEPEPEPEPPAPNSPEDRELVYAALENQSIRAIDILLVSPTATKPRRRRRVTARMRFDAAQAYCEELVVDGVGSWRLPEVGEAGWLSRANILREGVFWTATKADAFGGERVVWNSRARRMGTTSTRWKGGRVVCVRYQRPQPDEG